MIKGYLMGVLSIPLQLAIGKKVYAIGDDNKVIKQVAVNLCWLTIKILLINQPVESSAVAMLATPNPDKSFRIVNTMLDKVGKTKKLKKAEGSIEETKVVDGLTIKLKAYPQLAA